MACPKQELHRSTTPPFHLKKEGGSSFKVNLNPDLTHSQGGMKRETVINIEIKSYIVNYKCGDKDQKVTKGKHRILVKDMISSNFFKKT